MRRPFLKGVSVLLIAGAFGYMVFHISSRALQPTQASTGNQHNTWAEKMSPAIRAIKENRSNILLNWNRKFQTAEEQKTAAKECLDNTVILAYANIIDEESFDCLVKADACNIIDIKKFKSDMEKIRVAYKAVGQSTKALDEFTTMVNPQNMGHN